MPRREGCGRAQYVSRMGRNLASQGLSCSIGMKEEPRQEMREGCELSNAGRGLTREQAKRYLEGIHQDMDWYGSRRTLCYGSSMCLWCGFGEEMVPLCFYGNRKDSSTIATSHLPPS